MMAKPDLRIYQDQISDKLPKTPKTQKNNNNSTIQNSKEVMGSGREIRIYPENMHKYS